MTSSVSHLRCSSSAQGFEAQSLVAASGLLTQLLYGGASFGHSARCVVNWFALSGLGAKHWRASKRKLRGIWVEWSFALGFREKTLIPWLLGSTLLFGLLWFGGKSPLNC